MQRPDDSGWNEWSIHRRIILIADGAATGYIAANNRDPQPFTWTASADLILGRVANLCGELA